MNEKTPPKLWAWIDTIVFPLAVLLCAALWIPRLAWREWRREMEERDLTFDIDEITLE